MHRLIVAILAAVDAAIAVAVGVAATLAPVTLLWVFGLGGSADWGALWPASAVIWQFGNLVPLAVTIPAEYVAAAGIDPDAASFTLSLAPLAFATFTAIFAARSGVRASQADAWVTGVVVGSATFGSARHARRADIGERRRARAPVAGGALSHARLRAARPWSRRWSPNGARRPAARSRGCEIASRPPPHGWAEAPGLVARGTAVVVAGLVGLGALLITVALVLRGGEIIALYEAAHLDVLGAIVLTLAQLAYLPTLVVWGIAFIAGPGFALGTETSVSPAGTQVGRGARHPAARDRPRVDHPVAAPARAGADRARRARGLDRALPPERASALPTARGVPASRRAAVAVAFGVDGRLRRMPRPSSRALRRSRASSPRRRPSSNRSPSSRRRTESAEEPSPAASEEPIGARLVVALGIAVLSAVGAALLAAVASARSDPEGSPSWAPLLDRSRSPSASRCCSGPASSCSRRAHAAAAEPCAAIGGSRRHRRRTDRGEWCRGRAETPRSPSAMATPAARRRSGPVVVAHGTARPPRPLHPTRPRPSPAPARIGPNRDSAAHCPPRPRSPNPRSRPPADAARAAPFPTARPPNARSDRAAPAPARATKTRR